MVLQQQVVDGANARTLESILGNGEGLLDGNVRGLGPGRNERHAHAAFVAGSLLAAQWRIAGVDIVAAKGRVSAVITEEYHEGILGHFQLFELIENVAQ